VGEVLPLRPDVPLEQSQVSLPQSSLLPAETVTQCWYGQAATIAPDGTITIDWDVVCRLAAEWKPGCVRTSVVVAMLLLAARATNEQII
jgi:hypothetical protein